MEESTFETFLGVIFAALFLLTLISYIFKKRSERRSQQKMVTLTESELPDVVGPAGERVIVSVGPERQSLPVPHDTVSVTHSSTETVLHECGHHGPASYDIDAYGTVFTGIDDHRWCPDCLVFMFREKATRCALCGHVICPGDGVALYSDDSALAYKHVSTKVGDAFVGCMRWDCCPSGGFFAGHWTEEGFRSAFVITGELTHPDMPEKTV